MESEALFENNAFFLTEDLTEDFPGGVPREIQEKRDHTASVEPSKGVK